MIRWVPSRLWVEGNAGADRLAEQGRQAHPNNLRAVPILETHVKVNIFNIWPKINPLNESCPFLRGDRVVAW